MDKKQFIESEGGENMRDITELNQAELGEIVWHFRNGETFLYIARKLRIQLWQVEEYMKEVREKVFVASKITKIILEERGKKIELTVEEAKSLNRNLNVFFAGDEITFIASSDFATFKYGDRMRLCLVKGTWE